MAIGQENAFPWIERDIGIEFGEWDMPKVDRMTFMSTRPGVFFGGDAAWGPENIIWAVAHGHQAAISIDATCHGSDITERPAPGHTLISQKMGIHEWSYSNDYDGRRRVAVPHADKASRCEPQGRGRARLRRQARREGSRALPQLRRADGVHAQAVHRVRRLHGHLPGRLHQLHRQRRRETTLRDSCACRRRTRRRTSTSPTALKTGRIMAKDEDVCLHCGLCAERCPTGAWDMQKFMYVEAQAVEGLPDTPQCLPGSTAVAIRMRRDQTAMSGINDFVVKFATVNGSGSASANTMFAKTLFRMGIPVSAEEHLPVQHPGPADLVRGARVGGRLPRPPRRHRPDGRHEPADLQGGRRRGRAGRLAALRLDAAAVCGPATTSPSCAVPIAEMCAKQMERPAPAPAVQEHGLRRRADGAARHGHGGAQGRRRATSSRARRSWSPPTWRRWHSAATMRRHTSSARCRSACATPTGAKGKIMVTGNEAAGLGAVYAGATVCAWYPITPSTSLAEGFEKHAKRLRVDEGRQEALRHRAGRGRAGRHRRRHRRRLERRALVHGDLGPRHLADERVPRPRLLRRVPGRAVQHPARRPLDRHADAHRPARHHLLRLRLARRHQARAAVPVRPDRVLLAWARRPSTSPSGCRRRSWSCRDLDIGMNDWVTDPFAWDDAQSARPRQGADGRAARELQGVQGQGLGPLSGRRRRRHPLSHAAGHAPDQGRLLHARHQSTTNTRATPRTAASTRACIDRIRRKFDTAATMVPKPEIVIARQGGQGRRHLLRRHTPRRARRPRSARARRRQAQRAAPQGVPVHARGEGVLRRARPDLRRRAEPRRADALSC